MSLFGAKICGLRGVLRFTCSCDPESEQTNEVTDMSAAFLVTGVFLAEAAATLLEDDVAGRLPGGVLTPACLGQGYIDRLDRAGLHIEAKIVTEE